MYFLTSKPLIRQQIRWWEELGQYKFRIKHIKGKENAITDALSRAGHLTAEKASIDKAILQQNSNRTLSIVRANKVNNIIRIRNQVLKRLQEYLIRQYYNNLVHRHPSIK